MFLTNVLRRVLGRSTSLRRPHTHRKPARSALPCLERLEDRTVPSILFGDSPGLTTSDNGGPVISNALVRLVFWGNGWNTGGGPALRTQFQDRVDALNASTYFFSSLPGADLSQYRPGAAARPTRAGSVTTTFNSPGPTFTRADVINVLSHEFPSPGPFYYYVVPDPNSIPTVGGGEHTSTTIGGNTVYFGYSRNLATPSLDDLSVIYAEEMAESITDPDGTALQVNPRNPTSWNEIGDGEANRYTYRLNGVLAHSYWSRANGLFTIPTGQSQNFFVSFNGVLTVRGDQMASPNDNITLDASGGGVRVTLNNEVAQFEPGAISSIVVNTLSGNDTVNIERSIVPVTVNLGAGTDTINVSPIARNLNTIQGNLTLNGGDGVDTLNVFDNNNSFNETYTLNASNVGRSFSALISYGSLFNFVNINGGTGNDTYNVNGTEPGYATTLDTGPGNDTVNVRATLGSGITVNTTTGAGGSGNDVVNIGNAGSVQGILGAVTIFNDPSRDHVNIDDSADNGNRNVTISTGGVTGLSPAAINFTSFSVNTLSVLGGSGNNTYTVSGRPAGTSVTLNGGAGNNTLIGPNAPSVWVINANNAGTLDPVGISFTRFQNLTGGSFADAFVFEDGVGVDGNIDGGGGSNTLTYETVNTTPDTVNLQAHTATGVGGTFVNIQNFSGGAAANTLVGQDADTTWNITGSNTGNLTGGITFAAFQNLTGGAGADTFVFSDGAGVSGTIDGGGGTNTLNYAAYSTTVFVDLQTNTGTGVGGSVLNIQNVTGGTGGGAGVYNILVGNGGNVLTGGNGRRNLLIAGASASILNGGDSGDILIAGFTDYDTNETSLRAIAAYWAGTDDFDTRVANLRSGIGVPLLDAGATVHSNGGGNTVNAGAGRNLLFANDAGLDTLVWDSVRDTLISL
jgi:hypothetical protein